MPSAHTAARSNGITISDSFWTWGWRLGQFFAVLIGVAWFAFQLYSDVGGLKETGRQVKVDVKTLFDGQEKLTKTTDHIVTTLERVEASVKATQAQTKPNEARSR